MLLRYLLVLFSFNVSQVLADELWRCENNIIGVAYYKFNLRKPLVYIRVKDNWQVIASDSTKFKYDEDTSLLYALSQPTNKAGFVFDIENKTVYEAYKFGQIKKDYFSKCVVLKH